MSLISRLLGIWAVGKTVSTTTPLFMRLVVGMAMLTLFAVLAAVLLAILAAMVVWFAYTQLLVHGFTETQAMEVVAGAILLIITVIALVLRHYWMKAMGLARQIMFLQAPISGRFSMLGDAFMSGFNSSKAQTR